MTNFVLYHRSCTDGLAAAYCAWKALDHDSTVFYPVQYSEAFPNIDIKKGDFLYLLDFCYPYDVLVEKVPTGVGVVILDHHKTAESSFYEIMKARPYGYTFGRFDNGKSGAVLAWEWFMGRKPVPVLLQHIQDRDLWRFEMPGTEAIVAGLRATAGYRNFEVFDSLVFNPDGSENTEALKTLAFTGGVLIERDKRECESFSVKDSKKVTSTKFMGHKTALYNTTTLISDIGAAILRNGQAYDISMSYFVTSDLKMVFNLRSYDKGSNVDVGDIARRLGGGGHRNAAGFSLELQLGAALVQMLTLDDGSAFFVNKVGSDMLEVMRCV